MSYFGFKSIRVGGIKLPTIVSGSQPFRSGFFSRKSLPFKSAHAIVGLGWGDERKGANTDFVVSRIREIAPDRWIIVARFSGGPNAGHKVVHPSGKFRVFNQVPSGILVEGNTIGILSKLVDLDLLFEEMRILEDRFGKALFKPDKIRIFEDSTIILPYHPALGRMEEAARGDGEHGSIGRGVGEAENDKEEKIKLKELIDALGDSEKRSALERKLTDICREKHKRAMQIKTRSSRASEHYNPNDFNPKIILEKYLSYARFLQEKNLIIAPDFIEKKFAEGNISIVFEGSQGALLHPKYGPEPYVTKTNILAEAIQDYAGTTITLDQVEIIGSIRAYHTRHAVGPFPTEIPPAICPDVLLDSTRGNPWRGSFRAGWLDMVLLRYGIGLNARIDSLAVSCLDRLDTLGTIRFCPAYTSGPDFPPGLKKGAVTEFLMRTVPIYEEYPGWLRPTVGITRYNDLPQGAARHLKIIGEHTNHEVSAFSIGAGRNQLILL
ncbi:hypothetical protein A2276_07960 [candidate division WOR-1 bacterium RIFOXYA12_FULL_43_27]|uniref:Adenylosuccinate synthetase n=1 Tax=candidate division WOR-1 bacterium RIFOXYC2_FULL_46_14 TaxID=1802587 RepID=A0A1F4U607_UNCSA|nr:MAG: hypothetical protein A2276_07960 [candidate division WOR-1 bacterium RIFOXYA12_FULL_43_27]OGC20532.1 MAG: hypothetical protein A2292_05785 [candidate division WOR-1 bacterium RIFOXYB2_FULL_46_45]OGC31731.1 MAG: hypothetical protein A2232_05665 [candidate division WOR-1 bacterium RIFOXYA2_FULL_46_56]OGC40376.1 MAG: hypothetical protein A2438_03805 [candidate division WOR-1 bacterium RIFOXYC2_FULL_46_14]